jgi:hypothetical protein
MTRTAGHHKSAAVQPVGPPPSRPGVPPVGWGIGYPPTVTSKAFGRIAAGVERTLVVAGVPRIPGPVPADDTQEKTSHRDHRRIQLLVALLTAGLLLAACSGDGRSTVR